MPAAGAVFVVSKIDAIAANPEVWRKTAFILCFDENDGIFDRVAPHFAAGNAAGVRGRGAHWRWLPGPGIIVSPWPAGGRVCSELFDHTSSLRFLERFTGVAEPNLSAWRRSTFGDFTAAVRFADPARQAPKLPETDSELARALSESSQLPLPRTEQQEPRQEPGVRGRMPRV